MLFNESHDPDTNLEALYHGYFFFSTPMRTPVSWMSPSVIKQEGRRTGFKAVSPFVRNKYSLFALRELKEEEGEMMSEPSKKSV